MLHLSAAREHAQDLYRIELGVVRFSASLQHFIGPAILGEDLLQERRPKGPSAAKEGRVRMMRAGGFVAWHQVIHLKDLPGPLGELKQANLVAPIGSDVLRLEDPISQVRRVLPQGCQGGDEPTIPNPTLIDIKGILIKELRLLCELRQPGPNNLIAPSELLRLLTEKGLRNWLLKEESLDPPTVQHPAHE